MWKVIGNYKNNQTFRAISINIRMHHISLINVRRKEIDRAES